MNFELLKYVYIFSIILLIINSIGCMNYLVMTFFNKSFIIKNGFVYFFFGFSGLLLFICTIIYCIYTYNFF
jgi:hypothetical protein